MEPDIQIVPDRVVAGYVMDLLLSLPGDRAFNRPLRATARDEDVRVSGELRTTDATAMVQIEVDGQAPIGPRSLLIDVGEDTFEVPIAVVIGRERADNVAVDLMPGTCPNSLARKGDRAFRAAFLGSEELDPNEIDPASVRLDGLAPRSHRLIDVGAPAPAPKPVCSDGVDKILNLELEFDRVEVLELVGPIVTGLELSLELPATLADGTPIRGHDVITLAD